MAFYEAAGFYLINNEERKFTGILEIKEEKITGHLLEQDSICAENTVEGRTLNSRIEIKKTPSFALAPVFFSFDKNDGVDDLEGSYSGHWSYDIKIKKNPDSRAELSLVTIIE